MRAKNAQWRRQRHVSCFRRSSFASSTGPTPADKCKASMDIPLLPREVLATRLHEDVCVTRFEVAIGWAATIVRSPGLRCSRPAWLRGGARARQPCRDAGGGFPSRRFSTASWVTIATMAWTLLEAVSRTAGS